MMKRSARVLSHVVAREYFSWRGALTDILFIRSIQDERIGILGTKSRQGADDIKGDVALEGQASNADERHLHTRTEAND